MAPYDKNTKTTFSFDESEFAEQSEASVAADEAIQDIESGSEPEVSDSQALADVDLRLETADYYRAILRGSFFEVESPAGEIVDREVRAFVRERLEVLLGIRDGQQKVVEKSVFAPEEIEFLRTLATNFDSEEIKALKLLASKVLKKPTLVTEPALKPVAAPAPRQEIKTAPALIKKPELKKLQAPAPAPSTKPKAKPGPKPKPQEAKPAPAPARKPQQQHRPKPGDDAEQQTFVEAGTNREVTLTEGAEIEENGRKFIVVRNEMGTLYRKDVTGQAVNPNRIQPMSIQQMSIMSTQMAERQLESLDETTGLAIVASLQR